MMRVLALTLMSAALAGCASGPAPVQYQDISIPSLNETTTKFLGEQLLKQAKGVYSESVTLGNASGVYSNINAGIYCKTNPSSNRFYSADNQAVALKNLMGMTVSYSNFVTYDASSQNVCPNGTAGICYDSSEISIDYNPTDLCLSPNSFQQVIEYNGKSGDILNFTYREFANDMARSAFTTDFKMDLNEGDIIGYKGARLQVIEADNSKITYRVLANFNKQ